MRWMVVALLAACNGAEFDPDAGSGDGDGGRIDATLDTRPGLSIVFDYRYDDAGFFTPTARAVLEAAAKEWGDRFVDDFFDIPIGTSIRTRDPEAPGVTLVLDSTAVIEDLLVFVGCSAIDGPGGVTAMSNSTAALATVVDATLREQLRVRYEQSPFEPWTAWISFDCGENFFIDPTLATENDLPANQADLMSVAMHEVGHILGFGTAMTFLAKVNATPAYTGAEAMAVYGGPVPMMPPVGAHFMSGLSSDGREPLMDPTRPGGTRFRPTTLDRAALVDIGYELR